MHHTSSHLRSKDTVFARHSRITSCPLPSHANLHRAAPDQMVTITRVFTQTSHAFISVPLAPPTPSVRIWLSMTYRLFSISVYFTRHTSLRGNRFSPRAFCGSVRLEFASREAAGNSLHIRCNSLHDLSWDPSRMGRGTPSARKDSAKSLLGPRIQRS